MSKIHDKVVTFEMNRQMWLFSPQGSSRWAVALIPLAPKVRTKVILMSGFSNPRQEAHNPSWVMDHVSTPTIKVKVAKVIKHVTQFQGFW